MATIRKRTWKNSAGERLTAWQVSYIDQAKQRRRRQFDRKKDADSFLIKAQSEIAQGVHTPDSDSITVNEAAEIWLDACSVGRDGNDPVEPHTWRSYSSQVRHHITPLIGDELLSKLTTPRINTFRDQLLKTRSRSMAKRVLASLKAVLSEAQNRGFVAQNVARGVKVTTASRHKKDVRIPTKEQIRQILAMALEMTHDGQPHIARAWRRWHTLLLTATFTGMRASELRGLYWDAIDFNRGLIRVSQRADEKGHIGSVKSAAGRRDISLAPMLARVLREWRILCPKGKLVFPNWQGNVENYPNIHRRCWQNICRKTGLIADDGGLLYTFHHLRHFRASMLIASGATPKEVQTEIGHASIQTTFDIYGHMFEEDLSQRQSRAAEIETEILG